ncbi:SDR family NAD(P)-dependent oxidoreductase [Shouchella lehensis]|uniref:Glucose/ribitol dehydrogenase domain-containing protein n=1 Tax=Shouchella lehensis G1 TaxID=1246626 RepID=A0A060LUJ2_9BACI|nr:SDR family oxidoreductase [Shouchella lehensis]AIC93807.1 glucose/ribitol dehydrogenase domain-containing protein [Shouchella lehensis G1]
MNLQLKGKTVFVTGGTKGIGRAIALAFADEGCKVAVCARREEETFPTDIPVILGDVTKFEERERIFQEVTARIGPIDILINNAGGSNGAEIEKTTMDEFQQAFELNYFSAVHFSKLVLPGMKANKEGAIIQVSSIFGRESGGKATYNNAKAALISFTKALADEVMHEGIRVNSVAPGSVLHPTGNWQKRLNENPEKINQFVQTNIPAGRFGKPEEIADVVVFLASSKASWVTGSSLQVDGGQSKMNM